MTKTASFAPLYDRALQKMGSQKNLESYLPHIAKPEDLRVMTDAQYLSSMSRRIFQAGMTRKVVNARWPAFEEAFWGFEPQKLVLLSDAQMESHLQNAELIRHWTKMNTIPKNAAAMLDIAREYGSFGGFLDQWPQDDTLGLLQAIAKHFVRMGGRSAGYFLRIVGRDTYILTDSVIAALKLNGVLDRTVDKQPTAKAVLRWVDDAFNHWHEETQLPLSHLSQIAAFAVD